MGHEDPFVRSASSDPTQVPRDTIASLRRLALQPGSHVDVWFPGRIASVLPSGCLVGDRGASVWCDLCEGHPTPPDGAWVVVRGLWDGARVGEAQLELLNVPTQPFPAPGGDWRWLNDDEGRRMAHVLARAAMMRAVREYFDGERFVEVETPLAVPSPGLDTHLDAFSVGGSRAPRWLITSPEYQMKRLLSGGLTRIYQTCRCFRRDEAGALHQPEFSMLEWYRGGAGAEDVMVDTERLVAHAARALRAASTDPLMVPGRHGPIDLTPPWPRLTIAQAFQRFAGKDADALAAEDEARFFDVYASEVEPHLGREQPVFLTHWPASMASLARLVPGDPAHAERFELIVDGVELCNGFGELIDAAEQERRLLHDQGARAALGLPVYPVDQRFLDALREGLPPSGGNALGLDRLLMLLTGETHIDDVCAIPHARL